MVLLGGILSLGDYLFLFAQEHLWFALLLLLNFFSLCFFTELCMPEVEIHAGFWIIILN